MDDVITLIAERVVGYDAQGNEQIETQERDLMCQIYGVTRGEFYAAAAVNFRPDVTVRLSDFADYEGEKQARWNGELYSIIRTYRDSGSYHRDGGMPTNGIELILQHRIGDQEAGNGEICPGSNLCDFE